MLKAMILNLMPVEIVSACREMDLAHEMSQNLLTSSFSNFELFLDLFP